MDLLIWILTGYRLRAGRAGIYDDCGCPKACAWRFFPMFGFGESMSIGDALERVLLEMCAHFTPQFRSINGLDQFVKCYCFGEGTGPNLFWYGGAWRLSEQVGGPALEDARKIFVRHGFTHAWATDKNRLRDFEFY
jgi:hypothetical protein